MTTPERYYELTDKRDDVNKSIAPLQAELDKANADVQAAQATASAIAAKIQDARGGQKWLDLKKQIATIARGLGKIPPRA